MPYLCAVYSDAIEQILKQQSRSTHGWDRSLCVLRLTAFFSAEDMLLSGCPQKAVAGAQSTRCMTIISGHTALLCINSRFVVITTDTDTERAFCPILHPLKPYSSALVKRPAAWL